jgi:hypothetical protein
MQQLGKLSVGLASLTGWRRTAARLGAALAVLVLAAVIALGVAHSLWAPRCGVTTDSAAADGAAARLEPRGQRLRLIGMKTVIVVATAILVAASAAGGCCPPARRRPGWSAAITA